MKAPPAGEGLKKFLRGGGKPSKGPRGVALIEWGEEDATRPVRCRRGRFAGLGRGGARLRSRMGGSVGPLSRRGKDRLEGDQEDRLPGNEKRGSLAASRAKKKRGRLSAIH